MTHWIVLKVMDGGYTVYLKCSNCGLIVVRHLKPIDTCPCYGAHIMKEVWDDGEKN